MGEWKTYCAHAHNTKNVYCAHIIMARIRTGAVVKYRTTARASHPPAALHRGESMLGVARNNINAIVQCIKR